jgi:hypothetical protein
MKYEEICDEQLLNDLLKFANKFGRDKHDEFFYLYCSLNVFCASNHCIPKLIIAKIFPELLLIQFFLFKTFLAFSFREYLLI